MWKKHKIINHKHYLCILVDYIYIMFTIFQNFSFHASIYIFIFLVNFHFVVYIIFTILVLNIIFWCDFTDKFIMSINSFVMLILVMYKYKIFYFKIGIWLFDIKCIKKLQLVLSSWETMLNPKNVIP